MSKLADDLEGRVSAALAKGHLAGVGNLFVETLPAILAALRRVEKLEGELRYADAVMMEIASVRPGQRVSHENVFERIAKARTYLESRRGTRQALTGEA